MCTINEQLKSIGENAINAVNVNGMKKAVAIVAAKYFEPYRHELIKGVCEGASDEELSAEIKAFNQDTKNGTRLLIASYRVDNNGQLLDDENEVIENAELFATLPTTDKEGNIIRTKYVYSCAFVADTAQRNNRCVAYWFAYRETVAESFAAKRALIREQNKKELDTITAKVAALAIAGAAGSEEFNALVTRAQELKKQI